MFGTNKYLEVILNEAFSLWSFGFREDLIWLKYGDLEKAEDWKLALEKRQRFDRALRQEHNKKVAAAAKAEQEALKQQAASPKKTESPENPTEKSESQDSPNKQKEETKAE